MWMSYMRRFSWFYRNQISITAKAMQYSLFTVFVSANHRTEICIFVTFFAAFFSLFQLISDSNASLRSKTNWHYQLILFSLILITWLKSVLFFFQHFFCRPGTTIKTIGLFSLKLVIKNPNSLMPNQMNSAQKFAYNFCQFVCTFHETTI